MSGPRILAYGDPHGDWRPLLESCAADRPDEVVILGDCELDRPLATVLAPLLDAGIAAHWIAGNHDSDREEWLDNLYGGLPEGDLHGRVVDVGGVRLAGLHGIFRGKVWRPGLEPVHRTRAGHLAAMPRCQHWRPGWTPGHYNDGLPRAHRTSIYPEDIERLAALQADVLFCHDAPSCHRFGFAEIDALAEAMGARWIIHGHHHYSYGALLPSGVKVRGLRGAEPWLVPLL